MRNILKRRGDSVELALYSDGNTLRLTACHGKEIINYMNVPFNPKLITPAGLVNDVPRMAKTYNNAAQRMNVNIGSVIAAYSGHSLNNIIDLPTSIRGKVIEVAIRQKVIQIITGSVLENSYLSWAQVHPSSADSQRNYFYTLAVPKNHLRNFMDALIQASLKPRLVDYKYLALSRAVGEPQAVVLHVEFPQIEIVTLNDSIPKVKSVQLEKLDEENVIPHVAEAIPAGSNVPIYITGSCAHMLNVRTLTDAARKEGVSSQFRNIECPFNVPKDFPIGTYAINLGLLLKKRR